MIPTGSCAAARRVHTRAVPRFLHTSDWQLGMVFHNLAVDAAAQRARELRFAVLERIARLAHERAVDAVLVAGDVFDVEVVSTTLLQQARDALARFAPIPVVLLPGNHDPGTPGSALARLAGEGCPAHVKVALDGTAIELPSAGATWRVFPCPLLARHTYADPTAGLPARGVDDAAQVRVALAHGATQDFGQREALPNRIAADTVLGRGFDYLALGDWHGEFEVEPRARYSGAPEPTSFHAQTRGKALIVSIAHAGALPEVEAVDVGASWWIDGGPWRLEGDDAVARLIAAIAGIGAPDGRFGPPPPQWGGLSCTALRLELVGAVTLAQRAQLREALELAAERLMHLRAKSERLQLRPDAADELTFAHEPVLRGVFQTLLAATKARAPRDAVEADGAVAAAGPPDRPDSEESPFDPDVDAAVDPSELEIEAAALALLHRLVAEAQAAQQAREAAR
jgi:hypothetical protein